MPLADRIKTARKAASLSQGALADLVGVSPRTVSNYENGHTPPATEVLSAIATATRKSVAWLLETDAGGDGAPGSEPSAPESARGQSKTMLARKVETMRIPIATMGHAANGPNGGRDNSDAEEEALDTPVTFVQRLLGGRKPEPGTIFWSYVVGESMEPWLPDGTPILIERCSEIGDGGRYALWVDDGSGDIIKRCERLGGNRLHLISDNRSFPSRVLEHVTDADTSDTYVDLLHGHTLRLRVRGRIISPRDTSVAVMGQLADFARSLIRH